MDFGSHEDDYVTVITSEGEIISQLIAGYIDILLKKQRGKKTLHFRTFFFNIFLDTSVIYDDEDQDVGNVSEVAKISGVGVVSSSQNAYGYSETFTQNVTDIDSAAKAVQRMMQNLFGDLPPFQNTPGNHFYIYNFL